MPFALKRPLASNPKVKEWKYQDANGDGYLEIVKYKTREAAEAAIPHWSSEAIVVEVQWTAGEDESTYPDYPPTYNPIP
jgi:hypothetical protein